MKTGIIMSVACTVTWLANIISPPALAMDRLAALSQIESGDDDTVIGRAGEVEPVSDQATVVAAILRCL